ncbi:MAG: hypothetical protein QM726_12935 [Chitinophagaceae bacterium]
MKTQLTITNSFNQLVYSDDAAALCSQAIHIGANRTKDMARLSDDGPRLIDYIPNLWKLLPNMGDDAHRLIDCMPRLVKHGANMVNVGPNMHHIGPRLINCIASAINCTPRMAIKIAKWAPTGPNLRDCGPNIFPVGAITVNLQAIVPNCITSISNTGNSITIASACNCIHDILFLIPYCRSPPASSPLYAKTCVLSAGNQSTSQ